MTHRRHGGLQITGFSQRWLQEAGGRPRIRRLKAKRNQQLPSTTTTESMKSNDGGHFLTPFTHNQAKKTLSKTLKPSILSLNSCQGGADPKYSRILPCWWKLIEPAQLLTSVFFHSLHFDFKADLSCEVVRYHLDFLREVDARGALFYSLGMVTN